MPESRRSIPNELQRALMIEAGYRCVICKETSSLEIEHIVDYAKVKEHAFENMIVLCPTCHARKQNTTSPRHINTLSLKKIKQNIMLLNSRYSDLEKRYLENCFNTKEAVLEIDEHMFIFFHYLVQDGLATKQIIETGVLIGGFSTNKIALILTEKGIQFVESVFSHTQK